MPTKLFPEMPAVYTPQPGFTILVRDNYLYRHHSHNNTFIPFVLERADIPFYAVKDIDQIYVLPDEQTLCKTVQAGQCLEKYRYKLQPQTVDIFDGIMKALDSGKFVGYHSLVHGKCPVYKISDTLIKLYFEHTTLQLNKFEINSGNFKLLSFYVFNNEYDMWHWIIKGE